ncbi:amidohydrolase family protein [Acidisphaera sp. S103]|uniref:amidohydrolase family protein n=1 Tax=Acidisphaera sp. S103 TaxID=1747223 RepID=UPI00131BC254|nr:amidohydrolase family protein [Acidisphaera sp. S103]
MTTRPPKQKAPALSCDCHFHIFGPYDRFPLSEGRTYSPPPALVPQYLDMAEALGLQRMVVVQASVSGTDNAVTLDAIRQFGLHRARGVAVIDDSFDDAALRRLHDQGIRGVRFNMVSGNGTPEDQLEALGRRVAPLGWHIQIYADGEKMLAIAPLLARLPVEAVIDHCGGVMAALGTGHNQFQALLRLMDSGRAWMKVCGYRASSTGAPWDDVEANVKALVSAAPDRCVWGTDWPHPQMDPVPDAGLLLDQLFAWLPDAGVRRKVLVDNPARLYRF